ncbi:hypothetical protein CYLTODRAFT_445001 [Cylindrobasidium torrendii FP15055 ss-10]|uniref:Protein PIGBOS1 n=1 Tax=Cylindrobasidium torrendii FP15055 ss-10 TaxID=1314674 RepID=A0A0D7B8Y3_9AGAR|nr:hypothetical protein CYLTODRAFT_445001 [Cylindrobasidium torrendii FP15055 ss-10]
MAGRINFQLLVTALVGVASGVYIFKPEFERQSRERLESANTSNTVSPKSPSGQPPESPKA